MKKITFGLIVGTRGFFNSTLAINGKKALVELMEKPGYDYVILPNVATPTGVVETIQENYGCVACLSMSMLGDKLLPGACEVDVCGAVSMYVLTLASGKASAILDWNNNFGDDRNKCISWHCGNYPKNFVQAPIGIRN